jgi:hypothetical protein
MARAGEIIEIAATEEMLSGDNRLRGYLGAWVGADLGPAIGTNLGS